MLRKIVETVVGGAIGIAALFLVSKVAYAAGQEAAEEERRYEEAKEPFAVPYEERAPISASTPIKRSGKIGMLLGLRRLAVGGKKGSPISDFMNNPEEHKMEAYIDGGEIVVRVKKKSS